MKLQAVIVLSFLGGRALADTTSDQVRQFVAQHFADRATFEESIEDGLVYLVVRTPPVSIVPVGCIYTAEHLTLERTESGALVESSSSGSIPYVAERGEDGRCPSPDEFRYAELGISIPDLLRVREIVSMINHAEAANHRVHFRSVEWPPGTQVAPVDFFYRSDPADNDHPLIEVTLEARSNERWRVEIPYRCQQSCVLEVETVDVRR